MFGHHRVTDFSPSYMTQQTANCRSNYLLTYFDSAIILGRDAFVFVSWKIITYSSPEEFSKLLFYSLTATLDLLPM